MFGPRTVSTRPETCCVKISMDTIDPREKTFPTVLTPLQEVATGVDAGKVRRIVLMPARPRPRRRLRAQGVDNPDGDQRSPLPKPEHRHAIANACADLCKPGPVRRVFQGHQQHFPGPLPFRTGMWAAVTPHAPN